MEKFDFDEFDALCAETIEEAERTHQSTKICLSGLARVFNGAHSEQLVLFDEL